MKVITGGFDSAQPPNLIQMNRFYSNGKLLLTGEYLVLEGATALAVPAKFGQDLVVEQISQNQLIWSSFTQAGECWFEAVFDLPKIRLANATFNSDEEGSHEFIAETLQGLLQEARNLNPEFLNTDVGYHVKTHLTFPRDWGLGSSSTLINNIAQWAKVDAYNLLWNAFSGSGYDIACAQNDTPIFYQVNDQSPIVDTVDFKPNFSDHLYFVHLNQKQNSREGIQRFKEKKGTIKNEIQRVSEIAESLVKANSLSAFEEFLVEHESIISSIVELPKVKDTLFPDYFGQVKSLGAWGGDFVLATGNESTPAYFKEKGYNTILSYSDMVL